MRSRWLLWTVRIILGVVALLGAGIAVLFAINPGAAMLLLAVLIHPLVGNTSPPAMLKDDIAGMWGKWDEGSRRLTSHLQAQFPAGTLESALKSILSKQGFEPLPPPPGCVPAGQQVPLGCPTSDTSKELVYQWGNAICAMTITVRWTADGGNAITQVKGGYYAACL
jgi:hypothetical protein